MAQYYSEADYGAEEMSRPYANPGYCHGEGGERYVVRKEAYEEEIDEVERARRGHHHHGHSGNQHVHGASGHLGHSDSHHGYLGHSGSHHGHLGQSGSHHGHHVHGHGERHCDPCESKYDSCTGQYYG